jgi:hypothetical protein
MPAEVLITIRVKEGQHTWSSNVSYTETIQWLELTKLLVFRLLSQEIDSHSDKSER